MDIEALISTLVGDLCQVPGVAALVLGGSRARGTPVDILYRDLDAVAAVARACAAGRPRIMYQPGHAHGFITAIYLAEIVLCRPLWDPEGVVADLSVSCLMQALFALNAWYWMNEKGAVAIADAFPLAPPQLAARVAGAFGRLAPSPNALTQAIDGVDHLIAETDQLLTAAGFAPSGL